MKAVLPICLVLLYNNAFTTSQVLTRFLKHNPPPPNVTERRDSPTASAVFSQKLDHFDSNNTQTWSQRFFVNTEFFRNDGDNVAFLMLGGEDAASEEWMTSGSSWVNYGRKYGAILFQLEHRFYGSSQPFPDLATENLRFLSSQQALADAGEFVKAMTEQYSLGPNVKWVSFGGSYAGSLSAWLRLKYPELVHAAVASSAPLRAEVDYTGYFQVVIEDLGNINEKCVANLKKGMARVDELLANPNSSDETVTDIFNLCDPIEQYDLDHVNVKNFYKLIGYTFAGIVQYNGQEGSALLCNILNDETRGSEIHRIADILPTREFCLGYSYYDDVKYMKYTETGGYERQWTYQTCTEFGWYKTSNREDKVFGRGTPIDLYTQLCRDVFGPEFDSTFVYNQIDNTNADYHGTDINATRIVFVHGSVDPWHAAGLLKANNPDSPVIYIEGAAHCDDMYDPYEDIPQLIQAIEEISRLLGVWLSE